MRDFLPLVCMGTSAKPSIVVRNYSSGYFGWRIEDLAANPCKTKTPAQDKGEG
jgi:hypothetical protein